MEKEHSEAKSLVERNVEKLAALFPSCITEGRGADGQLERVVNFERLRELLSGHILEGNETYEFTWVGKRAAMAQAIKPAEKILSPCLAESVNWETTKNLYIEGGNLEALKVLHKTYSGQVKVIYIDPPYNTGSNFVYKDNFSMTAKKYQARTLNQSCQSGQCVASVPMIDSSGRFHSDWCSMIYPRLMLARELLSQDGVIFVSIDDNEVDNLRKICGEIFGEENFVECLKWKRKKQPSFLSSHTARVMEYVLVYAKERPNLAKLSLETISDNNKKVINLTNKVSIRHFKAGFRVKSMTYGLIPRGKYVIRTMEIEYLQDIQVKDGRAQNDVDVKAQFTVTQANIDKFIEEDLLFITVNNGLRRDVSPLERSRRKAITDLLLDWGDNQESAEEIRQLFGTVCFDYAKPVKLIYNLIKSVGDKSALVLDFFSGSATTAHAVMQLNAEDGGQRRFIMVQQPQICPPGSKAAQAGYQNICEIGKERIRRAGAILSRPDLDTGFRVFKLEDLEGHPN